MRRVTKLLPVLILPLLVSGCLTIDNPVDPNPVDPGPTEPAPTDPEPVAYQPFTSMSELKTSATTKLSGIGFAADYTRGGVDDPATEEDESLPTVGGFESAETSVDFRVDASGEIDRFTVYGPKKTRTWDVTPAAGGLGYASTNLGLNGPDDIYAMSAQGAGFEYQSFGIWATERDQAEMSVGSYSVGYATDIEKVPTTGSATFTGKAVGNYLDRNNQHHVTAADASLQADFAGKVVYFETSGTTAMDLSTLAVNPDAMLDIAGSMTYGNSNELSGTVANKYGMSGEVNGRFYGMGAQEIGGNFALTGDEVDYEVHVGSYGAKR